MVEPVSIVITVGSVYFLPSIYAGMKKSKSIVSILMLNIFLGWTIIGWIVALIWAITGTKNKLVKEWDEVKDTLPKKKQK